MAVVTDQMVQVAKNLLGVWNVARVRTALEAVFALLPEPIEPVCEIPVTASLRVVIDEAEFHRSAVQALHKLRAGLPLDSDGKVCLADLEASLGPIGGIISDLSWGINGELPSFPMPASEVGLASEHGPELYFDAPGDYIPPMPLPESSSASRLAMTGQTEVRSYVPGIYIVEFGEGVHPEPEALEKITAAIQRNTGVEPLLLLGAMVRPANVTDDELLREALEAMAFPQQYLIQPPGEIDPAEWDRLLAENPRGQMILGTLPNFGVTKPTLPANFPTLAAGVSEIATRLEVAKSTVTGWATKRAQNGMPEPVWQLASGAVYDLDAVVEWYEKWKSDAPTIGANDGGR